MDQRLHARCEILLVDREERRVVWCAWPIRKRRRVQEPEDPRHDARERTEVLGPHDRRDLTHLARTRRPFQGIEHAARERGIVGQERVAGSDLDVCGQSSGFGDLFGHARDALANVLARGFGERANGAGDGRFLWDDIDAVAAVNLSDCHHGRPGAQVGLSTDDALHERHQLRGHDDRILAIPRPRRVGADPFDLHLEVVRTGGHRTATVGEPAARRAGADVLAEHRFHPGVIEHPGLDHLEGPTRRALTAPFLCRLEQENHGTRQIGTHRGQDLGRAQQHRHVGVVSADVCDEGFLALPHSLGVRAEGQIGFLLHRQGIHVRSQADHRAWLAAFEDGFDPGLRDASMHLDARHGPEHVRNVRGRLDFLIGQLRALVDVTAPGDDPRLDLIRPKVDLLRGGGVHLHEPLALDPGRFPGADPRARTQDQR